MSISEVGQKPTKENIGILVYNQAVYLFIFSLVAFSEYMKFVDYKFTTLLYFSDIIPITSIC